MHGDPAAHGTTGCPETGNSDLMRQAGMQEAGVAVPELGTIACMQGRGSWANSLGKDDRPTYLPEPGALTTGSSWWQSSRLIWHGGGLSCLSCAYAVYASSLCTASSSYSDLTHTQFSA